MTIELGKGTFLLVVIDDHASILHWYRDMELQRFWGHEFDLLGSRDVIGHVTIRLGICAFLLVVHWNQASILHRYEDIKPQSCICHVKGQKFTAHAPCHVTCRQGIQNDHIFGIPEAILSIHYTIFMGLWRRIRSNICPICQQVSKCSMQRCWPLFEALINNWLHPSIRPQHLPT